MNRCCRESAPGLKTNTHRWKPAWQTKCTPPGRKCGRFPILAALRANCATSSSHPPVEQEDKSFCWTGSHVFLLNAKTCLLVQQEDMSSCSKNRRVFLLNKKHVWSLHKKTRLLVQQEDVSSCWTGRHAFCSVLPCSLAPVLRRSGAPVLPCSMLPCSGAQVRRYSAVPDFCWIPMVIPLSWGVFFPPAPLIVGPAASLDEG